MLSPDVQKIFSMCNSYFGSAQVSGRETSICLGCDPRHQLSLPPSMDRQKAVSALGSHRGKNLNYIWYEGKSIIKLKFTLFGTLVDQFPN